LELAFDTKVLRTICESEAHARRELGSHVAEALKHRLADLRAATSPKDLVAGRPRELATKSQRRMALDLSDGLSIVFCANHPKAPLTAGGDLDWSRVNRVKILRIGKENG
jgi:proteic killer suppression protein